MREYHATLNLTFQAHNEDEALDIAKSFKVALLDRTISPYKIEDVEVDDIEAA